MLRPFVILIALALVMGPACGKGREVSEQSAVIASGQPAAEKAPSTVRAKSGPEARVFIVEPQDGATVSSPVTVKFGAEGIAIEPAGEVKDGSGHHHLLVDVAELPPLDQPLPFNDNIIHFGKAQTEASINLSPGQHTLQLLLAGGNHIPLDPPVVSDKITITVE